MSTHPVFLIVRAKLGEATKALVHMNELDVQQCALRVEHPDLYSPDVHAESMVTNVQGIYTHFEAILKTLANTIDGFSRARHGIEIFCCRPRRWAPTARR